MRDIYYQELRKNCAESSKFTTRQMEKVLNAVKNVLIFYDLAKKEGILYLEELSETLNKETEDKYFVELIMLLVDGVDSILLSEYALNRYFAANLTGDKGIIYLIYLKGVLMIKKSENSMVIEKILESMLPENVRNLYIKNKRKELESATNSEKENTQYKIDLICNKVSEADEQKYTLLSEASLFFENSSDQVIQRILREVDCLALSVAMKGLSGNACRRIFSNLSKRVATMIVDDMECMESIKMRDVTESVINIMNVILKLANTGEINDNNLVALKIVIDIYNSDKRACNMYKERYSKLKRALDEIWEN
jgi:hypothetical protein